jgi:hypothetical protein
MAWRCGAPVNPVEPGTQGAGTIHPYQWKMTMSTTKTLILATFAALSLGAGSAMAQGSDSGVTVYRNGFYQATPAPAQARSAVPVQSGSSDVEPGRTQSPINPTTQPQFDFSGGGSGD